MDKVVERKGNSVRISARPEDAEQRIRGLAEKKAAGQPLTDDDRDWLLLAILQRITRRG